MASSSKPPPEERAAEIVNSLPSSPNLVTKTGTVILGTGLLATAISQELYVVNEETVIAAGFFILISAIYKVRVVSYRADRVARAEVMTSRVPCSEHGFMALRGVTHR